jgi:SnoaL-like domain
VEHDDAVTIRDASDVLRDMVEMFRTGNLVALDQIIAPEYLDHQGLDGSELHGPAGFARVVEAARVGYKELDVTIEDLVVGPDRAAARLRWRGGRVEADTVTRETIDIVRVDRHGRAVEHWGGQN